MLSRWFCCFAGSAANAQQQHSARKRPPKQQIPDPPPPPAPPPPPPTLEQLPAVPPKVTFSNGLLTIVAENSTLADILRAVRAQTGAVVEVPPNATERVVAHLGPGPARECARLAAEWVALQLRHAGVADESRQSGPGYSDFQVGRHTRCWNSATRPRCGAGGQYCYSGG